MSGMLSKALSALFKENEELVANARILGVAAASCAHRRELATDMGSGETTFRWCVEFKDEEDVVAFDGALRNIILAVTEEGRE